MDIKRIHFMRELLVTDGKGKSMVVLEFSYDDRFAHKPRFFGVPDDDQARAHQLYLDWGGSRPPGDWVGTTVSRPAGPAAG